MCADLGSCTAPGEPAATCRVVHSEDLASDGGWMSDPVDDGQPDNALNGYHGTNGEARGGRVRGAAVPPFLCCFPAGRGCAS